MLQDRTDVNASSFLMHRVELKALKQALSLFSQSVPNAPCGVESEEDAGLKAHLEGS